MKFIDLWSLVAGIASIISLLIVMSDKLPKWKKYIYPTALLLGGFAIGRTSFVLTPASELLFKDPIYLGLLVIIIIVIGPAIMLTHLMLKKNENWYAYLIFLMVLMIGLPNIMDKYLTAFKAIKKEDYLLLAKVKEDKSDYSSAIEYLEKYKNLSDSREFNEKIKEKIKTLKGKQLQLEKPD
jgi:hypothetical protein